MTIDTHNDEFNLILLDESNRDMTNSKTPVKSLGKARSPVTPESGSSCDLSVSCNSSVSSDGEPASSSFQRANASVSDHKLAELAGRHAEEPLLKENPHRYVLFPIQDDDVSQLSFFIYTMLSLKI